MRNSRSCMHRLYFFSEMFNILIVQKNDNILIFFYIIKQNTPSLYFKSVLKTENELEILTNYCICFNLQLYSKSSKVSEWVNLESSYTDGRQKSLQIRHIQPSFWILTSLICSKSPKPKYILFRYTLYNDKYDTTINAVRQQHYYCWLSSRRKLHNGYLILHLLIGLLTHWN